MIKYCLKNPDGSYGASPEVFPTFVHIPTVSPLLALFTRHELKRALARGQRYGTSELKEALVKGTISKLDPSL